MNVPIDALEILRDEFDHYYQLDIELDNCQKCGTKAYVIQKVTETPMRTRESTSVPLMSEAYVTKVIRRVKRFCTGCFPIPKDNPGMYV